MYRNHRVHLLTPNREPSRHQNVPTVSHGPSRNIISQPQYLKATSQRYADFSRFSSIFYLHQALGERTVGGTWTIITTCVLQLAVDEASSNQPFHPLLLLFLMPFAFLAVWYYYYYLRKLYYAATTKNHAITTLCAKPGYDVIYFCPFVCVVGII